MVNGFPKPSGHAGFPSRPADALAQLISPLPSAPLPAALGATPSRRGVLRALAPWCALAALGVAALLFSTNSSPRRGATSAAPVAPGAAAREPSALVAPTAGARQPRRAPNAAATPPTSVDVAPAPFLSHDVPRVPEAYTGDPEGQALWEKTVEEEQQTLQPDDLVEEPAPPRLDLSQVPAYQAEHIDADGNLN